MAARSGRQSQVQTDDGQSLAGWLAGHRLPTGGGSISPFGLEHAGRVGNLRPLRVTAHCCGPAAASLGESRQTITKDGIEFWPSHNWPDWIGLDWIGLDWGDPLMAETALWT